VGGKEDVAVIIRALEHFDICKLGAVAYFLSMEIVRDRKEKTLMLKQSKYAREILQRTCMRDFNGKSRPM
jgi:hypothetical protein